MPSYGYYLPLSEKVFESVRFLDISEKLDGFGEEEKQKISKDGTPVWVIGALVKLPNGQLETETFTLTATRKEIEALREIPELAPIRLIGLAAGKWSKAGSDSTSWSFQISGLAKL